MSGFATVSSAPLFLALRYLRPRRSFVSVITVISILGVMLGVGVLVVVMSVFKGWEIEYRRLVLGFEPHLMLRQDEPQPGPADPANPPMGRTNWRDVIEILKTRPEVASAVPVASGGVAAEGAKDPVAMSIIGLKPAADNALAKKLARHIKEGAFDLDGDHIVLTDKQAEQIGAKLGDTVVLYAADNIRHVIRETRSVSENEPDEDKRAAAYSDVTVLPSEVRLVGILRGDTAEAGGSARGYVPLHIGQELFNLEDRVTEIGVELSDPDRADEIADLWMSTDVIPLDWSATTWMGEHGWMLANVENQKSLMWFLLLVIMVVASSTVMNTTITVTVQKRREIGILAALGSRARQIIGIFLSQAAVVAAAGVLLGIAGGLAVLHFRNDLREWIAKATGRDFFPSDIYFLSSIPARTEPADLLGICAAAGILCLLAALVPAYFAARVDPAEALRD